METYISILRGINVGGHRKIKMDDLKKMYADLNLKNAKSYIQSGNLVFQSAVKDYRKIEKKITVQIKKVFGYDVPVMVRQLDELTDVFENNPLLIEGEPACLVGRELNAFHVTFLSDVPKKEDWDKINPDDYKPELFNLRGRAVYLYSPNGYHKARLSNNLFEKKLKVEATSRNWRTVTKLVEMAGE